MIVLFVYSSITFFEHLVHSYILIIVIIFWWCIYVTCLCNYWDVFSFEKWMLLGSNCIAPLLVLVKGIGALSFEFLLLFFVKTFVCFWFCVPFFYYSVDLLFLFHFFLSFDHFWYFLFILHHLVPFEQRWEEGLVLWYLIPCFFISIVVYTLFSFVSFCICHLFTFFTIALLAIFSSLLVSFCPPASCFVPSHPSGWYRALRSINSVKWSC